VLGPIEVVLSLCESESAYDMSLVRGVVPSGCTAVCSVLEFFVPEPDEGSVPTVLNHAPWRLDDFVCASPSFS
jgi:hypothetical protein